MSKFLTIMAGLSIFLTMNACGSKSDSQKAIDDAHKSIGQTKKDIGLGCASLDRAELLKDLQEKHLEPADISTKLIIKANTVLICGHSQIKKNMTLISARTVVLSNVEQTTVGAVDKILSINAQDLILEGENKIASKGKDGSSTILQGPSVSISAEKISGIGKLEITSEGSNYQGESNDFKDFIFSLSFRSYRIYRKC